MSRGISSFSMRLSPRAEQYLSEQLGGGVLTERLFENVGGGAAVCQQSVYVGSGADALLRLVCGIGCGGVQVGFKVLVGQRVQLGCLCALALFGYALRELDVVIPVRTRVALCKVKYLPTKAA